MESSGLGRVVATMTRTGLRHINTKTYGYGTYGYSDYQHVRTNNEQLIDSENRTEPISNTVSVEWTQFNGGLSFVKVDADDPDLRLDIQGTISGPSGTQSFTTTNGEYYFDNLTPGSYTITETANNNYGYSEEVGTTVNVSVGSGTVVSIEMTNTKNTGNLIITKKDQDQEPTKYMGNVSFKIRNGNGQYVVAVDDNGSTVSRVVGSIHLGNMQFTSSESQATEFVTDSSGTVAIYNMLVDNYTVEEVALNTDEYGYELDDNYIFWSSSSGSGSGASGQVQVVRQKSTDTTPGSSSAADSITFGNRRKYIRLSGIVWEDMIDGKTSERNSLYSSDVDKLVANVTVKLKDSSGNDVTFNDASGNPHTQLMTDADGYYEMWDILIDNLEQYYIEFSYNGMSYTNVPIVGTLSNERGQTKAIEGDQRRSEFNERFAEITYKQGVIGQAKDSQGNDTHELTYEEGEHSSTLIYGDSPLYGYDGQRFPINNVDEQYMISADTKEAYTSQGGSGYLSDMYTPEEIRQQGLEEIPNIDLGLREREQPDLALVEDVHTAKITLNGYEHTYKYSQRFDNPGVFNESTGLEGGEDGFNVAVKFGNKYGSQSYTREIFSSDIVYNQETGGDEGKLGVYITYKIAIKNEATNLTTRANEIMNYFDERYEVNSVKDEQGNDLEYNVDSYNSNGYKRVIITTDQNIEAQTQEIIYIEYKLNNEAVNSILNQDVTLNSVTEISSYSSFLNDAVYGGVDKDSRPGSADPQSKETYEDDTDSAPSMILTLKEARIIAGNVWEDNAIQDLLNNEDAYRKERKGDGILAEGENRVGNVKVELILKEGDTYSVAKLYHQDGTIEDASMYTENDGEYTFSGMIPGNYLIRYTYGDESVIYDSSGNEISNVDIINYKSTIYRGGDKSAAEAMTDYWYRAETDDATRLSDASDKTGIKEDGTRYDIVADRTTSKDIDYGTALEDEKLKDIEAETRLFDVKLDYDINLDNISEYGADLKFLFNNIDLGIIRRPIQNLEIKKEISHVQVVLANGQVVIDGDPRDGTLQYVRFLPDGNVHIELDSELLQGATLNITYSITVDNTKAEIDYNDEDYYIYGIFPEDNYKECWKLATVETLLDYLSNDLVYDDEANSEHWTEFNLDDSMIGINFSEGAYEALKAYNRIFQTDYFADMEPGQVKSLEMKASRILSNKVEDYSLDNDMEVNKLKEYPIRDSTPGNYIPSDETTYENDNDRKYIVVTGPTGENRNYLPYILLGVSSFIILAAGVVFIKKKVL